MAKPDRISKTWTIRKDLAERVEAEADSRVVGQALIVERALEHFLEGLAPALDAGTVIPPVDEALRGDE